MALPLNLENDPTFICEAWTPKVEALRIIKGFCIRGLHSVGKKDLARASLALQLDISTSSSSVLIEPRSTFSGNGAADTNNEYPDPANGTPGMAR